MVFGWVLTTGLVATAVVCCYGLVRNNSHPKGPVFVMPREIVLAPQHIGDIADAVFNISNSGTEPLTVGEFRSGCGCDSLEYKSASGYLKLSRITVAPGDYVEIRLRHKVRMRVGEEERSSIFCETNDPVCPEASVTLIIPTVTGEVAASPSVVTTGELVVGSVTRHTVNLFDSAAQPRKVTRVISTDPEIMSVRLL
jgi:hypothetical protein